MGGKKSTTTSKVSIPPEVLARYNAVNTRAETAAAAPFQAFGNTAADYVAQLNARQNAGFNDINATAGSYLPYMTEATTATRAGLGPAYEGIDNYMSPYIKNVADTTGAYLRQQQEQAQSGALGNAISSGAFGGDRAGIAAANLQQQNQMAYGKTIADILNQGYTQALGASQADLARQLAGGEQLAGLGAQSQQLGLQGAQAKIAAGTMEQQTEQAGKDAMINRFMQEKGYPFQTAQFLANIAMGTGAASGSTTTTTTPKNWLGFASGGGVSGYAEGGGVAGPRTYSQGQIGGSGYVPAGDLPVGQLMVADPPQQEQGNGMEDVVKLIAMMGGAKNGGAIDQRHGYALDGAVDLPWWKKALGAVNSLGDVVTGDPRTQEGLQRRQAGYNAISTILGVAGPVMGLGPQVAQLPASPWVNGGPYHLGSTSPAQPAATGVVAQTPGTEVPAPAGVVAPATPATPPATPPAATGVVAPATPATPPAGADVASDAMVAVGQPNPATLGSPTQTSSLIDQKAPTLEPKPSNWDMADTGLAPTGGYGPVVPVKKQLDFVMYELQKPEYKGYLENTYATPAQAAVAFERVYERANGSGNNIAAANATDIYNAAQSGKLDQMPPNVVTAYNHFIQNGMDPIQAAGATGRLMVESYAHLDPNARNTLGGGYGTYGLAQWRGSRMEELANFAGVPLDAITGAPVSTPEGRYYSHGADFSGGLGGGNQGSGRGDQVSTDGLGGADVTQRRGDPLHINKPYEDRNLIGQFFHDPATGKLNPIAIKALLSGISGAAQAKTISPLGGILAGIGAGSDTYNTLQNEEPKRVADIMANSKNARIQYLTEVAMGEERPFEQWAVSKYGSGPASMFGPAEGGSTANQPMGRADILGSGLSQNIKLPNGVVVQGGQNYAHLTKLANDLQPYVAAGVPAAINTMATVEARLTDIRNSQGVVQDINGNDVKDPTYTSTLDTQTRTQFGREKTLEFEGKAIEGQQRADRDLSMINHQVDVFTKFPAGALATDKAAGLAILQSLGVPVPADTSEYAAAAQEALKGAARKLLDSVGTDAPAVEMAQLQQAIESPNMQPEAIKTILSMQKAQAEREKQYYKLRPEWNAANPSMAMDQSAYEDWFTTAHPFEKYYQDAKAGMPIFAGELGSKQKPHPAGTAYSDIGVGQYFTLPDGKIGQREE